MHFDFTISMGSIITASSVLVLAWRVGQRIWEHDIMWATFCYERGWNPKNITKNKRIPIVERAHGKSASD